MKNVSFKIEILSVLLLISTVLYSQNEKDTFSIKNNEKSYVSIDFNFISDAVFMGRKDSIAAPYLYPSITYHHNSGLYGKGSFSYLTKSNESRIDLFLTTIGIDFTNKKFSGDFSATKYFFNSDSYNIISEVEADITGILRYDFDVFNVSVMASNYFSKNSQSDFFLSSEISHDFITSNNKFQISPTIGVHFGSQNFYQEYVINKQIKQTGTGTGSGNGMGTGTGTVDTTTTVTEIVIEESEKFKAMAIELSLPIWYIDNSFTISFLPVLAIPQSETNIIVNDTFQKENLKETFYLMIGIGYRF
mgnify:CR=1 FL=1|jgi:hypothetical protein